MNSAADQFQFVSRLGPLEKVFSNSFPPCLLIQQGISEYFLSCSNDAVPPHISMFHLGRVHLARCEALP